MWFEQMHPSWQTALGHWQAWLQNLEAQVGSLPDLAPTPDKVMAAFALPLPQVRVVIIGQDPYPTPGVAVGRGFAIGQESGGTAPQNRLPASLRNILVELAADLTQPSGHSESDHGPSCQPRLDLLGWQNQGVFLLNRHLTTVHGNPGAHFKLGWDAFTLDAIRAVAAANPRAAYILWGNEAQKLAPMISQAGEHPDESGIEISEASGTVGGALILKAPHPSPLSAHRGFFGSKPFSQVNTHLALQGQQPIDWFD